MAMKSPKQPTETIEQFSNHLKTLRTQKGLSQGELAARAGITRQAVSSIESNLYLPTTGVALHLASVLACRVEDLFSLAAAEEIVEGKLIGHVPQRGMMAPPVRVKVFMVGSQTIVRPVSGLGEVLCFTVPADGYLLETRGQSTGATVRVKLTRDRQAIEQAISVAACNPAI